jgi:hypothetical protein
MNRQQVNTKFTLEVDTGSTVSDTIKKILFISPEGITGEFLASSIGAILSYDVTSADINECGEWEFQAYTEDNAGGKTYGTKFKIEFLPNI